MSATVRQAKSMSSPGCSKALRQSVFDVLTCPLCKEYMHPPITLCQGGHNICSSCRPGLQFSGGNKCPRCRRPLLETRNVALETIARGLRYPCRYNGSGCREKFSMEEIAEHHAHCVHRLYDCPLRALESCTWCGSLPEVHGHVEATHSSCTLGAAVVGEGEFTWEVSNAECYQNSHHAVFALGDVFVFHKRFDIPQRKLFVAVQQCWGAQERCRYELLLHKNSGKQTALLSSVVHGDKEDLEQVFLSGDCIKVDFDMLMNFVKGTRTMRIVATRSQ
ncbi:E3 ubiquitin-protein ligase sina-like isoform X2 [Periplaneta americana]